MRFWRYLYLSLAFLTLTILSGCNGSSSGSKSGGSGQLLYVASGSNGQGQIWSFKIDASSGSLTPGSTIASPEYLLQLKVDASNKFLYASDFDAGKVRVYAIDSRGTLTEVPGSPFGSSLTFGNGGPIAVTPNGKYVFFSDELGDIVSFSNAAGTLTAGSNVAQDGNQPYDMAVDPAGEFLYVANHSDGSGGEFSVYSIDPSTGTLTAVTGSPFTFNSNNTPFGIVVHPRGQYLYSTLENTQDVAGLTINTSTGALTYLPGSPYNDGVLAPAGIAIHPSGKFLYVSAIGTGSIVAFKIDSGTGVLSKIGSYPGGGPVQLIIDHSGKFLYATYPGAGFHQIAAYQIDQTTGGIAPVPGSPLAAGADPGALALAQLP